MLQDFAKYLEDEAKRDEDDLAPIVDNRDAQMQTLVDKIKECDAIIKEVKVYLKFTANAIVPVRRMG